MVMLPGYYQTSFIGSYVWFMVMGHREPMSQRETHRSGG